MVSPDKYGQWAMVIGAAEGIGKAFSEKLASLNFNLILVDKSESLCNALAEEIQRSYQVKTNVTIVDLAEENAHQKLIVKINDLNCHFLVYNAAYGPVKPFLSNTKEELDMYLNVNSHNLIHLVHGLFPAWEGKKGGIIIMSSLAGLFGTRLVAPYGATKAFDFNLGEALYHEWKDKGVDVLACCAGATDTPNFRKTKPDLSIFPKPYVSSPENIPVEAFKKLGKTPLHIVGFQNRVNHFILSSILPRKLASKLFNQTMARLYGQR